MLSNKFTLSNRCNYQCWKWDFKFGWPIRTCVSFCPFWLATCTVYFWTGSCSFFFGSCGQLLGIDNRPVVIIALQGVKGVESKACYYWLVVCILRSEFWYVLCRLIDCFPCHLTIPYILAKCHTCNSWMYPASSVEENLSIEKKNPEISTTMLHVAFVRAYTTVKIVVFMHKCFSVIKLTWLLTVHMYAIQ